MRTGLINVSNVLNHTFIKTCKSDEYLYLFPLLSQGLQQSREERRAALASGDGAQIERENRRFQSLMEMGVNTLGTHFLNFLPHLANHGDRVSFIFNF